MPETPNLEEALAIARSGSWAAYCTDCDTNSGRLASRAEAEVWPTLHRVLSPTCKPPHHANGGPNA